MDLIGVSWPNVDEDDYREMAKSLRSFAEEVDSGRGDSNVALNRLLSTNRGQMTDAVEAHVNKLNGKHLHNLAEAGRLLAGGLDGAAVVVAGAKSAAIVQLGILASEVAAAQAAAPITLGFSELGALSGVAVTRTVVKRLFKEAARAAAQEVLSIATGPVFNSLDAMATDLVVQVVSDGLGAQDGVDLKQTVQAGKQGLTLASAGGGGLVLDSTGGGSGDLVFDEHEHATFTGAVHDHSRHLNEKGGSHLRAGRHHFNKTRGRGSLARAIEQVVDKAVKSLGDAHGKLHKHLDDVGKSLTQAGRAHQRQDHHERDKFRQVKNKGVTGNSGADKPGGSSPHVKPASLRNAKEDPRRNGIPLEKTVCKNDPVDVATGEMLLPETDLSLPGVLPLVLRRTHLSEYRYGQWFGRSWASTLDERIEPDPVGGGAVWARDDGSLLVYPRLPRPDDEPVLPLEGPRLPLAHGGEHNGWTTYLITDPSTGITRTFTGSPYHASTSLWLDEIGDRNGNTVTFARCPDGTPTSVSHTGGYSVRLTAENSRVTTLSLPTAQGHAALLTYAYDERGDLSAVTNSSGSSMRFTYDAEGRITSWTDRNNHTFRYVYDALGRIVRTVGPDGFLSSTFEYAMDEETGHRITRYTDSTGAVTTLRLNNRLQVVAETDPLGHTTLQTWDRYDRLLTHTDPLGHSTELTWDEAGNLTAVRLPDGTGATARYNELNLPVEITDASGSTWRQTYDELGNCTGVESPDGAVTRFTHDRTGAVSTLTDALGAVTRIRSDGVGLPIEITDARSAVTRVERDHQGRPVRIQDAAGNIERFEWGVGDQLLVRVAPDGSRETWDWDGEGNCRAQTHPHGGTTSTEYGPFDKPTARVTPDGARYELKYDTELRLVQVINPCGQSWDYTYDRAGRLTAETDFDNRRTHYTYDPAGRLASRTNPLGQTTTYTWDAMGRMLTRDADGDVTRYTYGSHGQLVGAVSPTSTLTMEWDAFGRLVAETVDGRTSRYAYDRLGRRTVRTTPTGAVSHARYDAAGDRVSLTTDGHALSFAFDDLGREVSRSWGAPKAATTLTTAWDALNRPVTHNLTAVGTILRTEEYAYRPDDHPISLIRRTPGGGRQEKRISLDPVGRPLTITAADWAETYAYDATGNQVSADWPVAGGRADARGARTYDGTRLLSAGSIRYEYDDAGRVVQRRRIRLSRKPEIWRYTYDAEDRLVSCTTPDGTQWRYSYDPLGRRTAKHRLAADGHAVLETVRFTWDETRLAEQSDSVTGTILTWEYDGYHPVSQYERKPLGADEVDSRFFAIVTDLVGTPTELVSETGEKAWQARSTCWGVTAWNTDAVAYTPLRFPGQYADPETGLHYNFFRHYDPDTARYTTPDPLGLAPAPNPSTYVVNPWVWADPLGLAPSSCRQDQYDWEGSIRYERLDHLGRPTGVHGCLRREMLRKGSPAGDLWPPGWRGNGKLFNEARGHLLANLLGGHGKGPLAYHNLITQTQNPTNTPRQRLEVEKKIYEAVRKGEIVQYSIRPRYEGNNPIPIKIEYVAFGNRGFNFVHSLDNPAAGVRTPRA
ncbi:DUF6531 domain-containing protein [Streptomyces sp. TYQ1024]|uniref:DUF6531 domain-containing protein n=1 Tax=Streptomyces sp. TYQ1024 TaxID=2762559 RepID=UPI001C8E07E3|nr:DUF6531 domain-containing protein [Streptomyces sp. TYQ1024]